MNLVILVGNLCKEVEVKTTANGTSYMSNSIAVKRKFHKDGEPETDFFDLVIFGKSADAAGKYLHKGAKVAITGSIQNSSYTTREGEKKTSTKVMVSDWEFAESKTSESKTSDNDFLNVSADIAELPFM